MAEVNEVNKGKEFIDRCQVLTKSSSKDQDHIENEEIESNAILQNPTNSS